MKFKLAAIDLDDTLLSSSKEISEFTITTIKELVEKGLIVVLASGRNYRGSKKYYDQLGLSSPIISCGGAVIVDKDFKEIFKLPLDNNHARKVLLFARENNLHAQIENSAGYYFEKHNKYSRDHEIFYGYKGEETPDLINKKDIISLKILILSEPEIIQKIKPEAEGKFPELLVTRSLPTFLEFNNPKSSKGRALEFLSTYYLIKREEIIAFGDSELDLSMMEFAGLSVAVNNASKVIKDRADYITDSNDNEGVANALKELII